MGDWTTVESAWMCHMPQKVFSTVVSWQSIRNVSWAKLESEGMGREVAVVKPADSACSLGAARLLRVIPSSTNPPINDEFSGLR